MRSLEKAYLRLLLDATFETSLRCPVSVAALGLEPHEASILLDIPKKVLAVERRGRRLHLWARAQCELPMTLRRATRRVAHADIERIQESLFSQHIWRPERTAELAPYGKGYELASHVVAILNEMQDAEPTAEVSLLAQLAMLERAIFLAKHTTPHPGPEEPDRVVLLLNSSYDLATAANQPALAAPQVALAGTVSWVVTGRARVLIQRNRNA